LTVFFLRDPQRTPDESAANALLAPADGRVVEVSGARMPYTDAPALKVDIFLSVLDVHINRSPAAGKVAKIEYKKGSFRNALKREAGDMNESNVVLLQLGTGQRLAVKQIAGAIARRIVCRAKEGDFLFAGQRFGMIMFGSRTQVFIPSDVGFEAKVTVGQHVKAGKTVLGYLK
jgi:phosphatidylserine decarboxylase